MLKFGIIRQCCQTVVDKLRVKTNPNGFDLPKIWPKKSRVFLTMLMKLQFCVIERKQKFIML